MTQRWTRRSALAAGLAGLAGFSALGACTAPVAPVGPSGPGTPDPLLAALTAQAALRDRYDAALAAAPSLASALPGGTTVTVLRAEADAHVQALAAALGVPVPSPAASASGGSAATSSAPPAADPTALLAGLRNAEAKVRDDLLALVRTVTAERAPLVGSLSASAACHVAVLS